MHYDVIIKQYLCAVNKLINQIIVIDFYYFCTVKATTGVVAVVICHKAIAFALNNCGVAVAVVKVILYKEKIFS